MLINIYTIYIGWRGSRYRYTRPIGRQPSAIVDLTSGECSLRAVASFPARGQAGRKGKGAVHRQLLGKRCIRLRLRSG